MNAVDLLTQRMREAAEAAKRELTDAGAGDLVYDEITVTATAHGVKVAFFKTPAERYEIPLVIERTSWKKSKLPTPDDLPLIDTQGHLIDSTDDDEE